MSWALTDIVELCVEPVPAWHSEAACREGIDPETFFPDRGGSSRPAKAICQTCPVQRQCLAHAVEAKEAFGIWGGTAERERRTMRKRPGRLSA